MKPSASLFLAVLPLLACDPDSEGGPDAERDPAGKGDAVGEETTEAPRVLIADLDAPESVVFDIETQTYFVSNLAHDILKTDPLHPPTDNVGFISQHALDGGVIERRFAEGFASPKGLAAGAGLLFVADPKHVIALDVHTGEEVARYTMRDVGLLNDVALTGSGTLYVTDTANPGLYAIDSGHGALTRMRVVARDDRFEFLNGVAVAEETVYVVSTGILPSESGAGTLGRLFEIDPHTGSVREIEGVRGRWDGVVVLDGGFLALDDFLTGEVHLVDRESEETTKLLDAPVQPMAPFIGIADMGADGSTLLIPSMFTNEVLAFTPTLPIYE
jgi:outer membrane protein assembly factor BamB